MSNPIEDYAFISDMESGALIALDGSIDWLCWPRFDSAACFCSLLHDRTAGRWAISPTNGDFTTERSYTGESLVLRTVFTVASGSAAVIDCLAIEDDMSDDAVTERSPRHVLVRLVEGIDGEVEFGVDYQPRFDYGSVKPWLRSRNDAIEAIGGPDALDLVSSIDLEISEGGVATSFTVSAGEEVAFLLSYHPSHLEIETPDPDHARPLIERTQQYWEGWAGGCSYDGPWHNEVIRSLLTLKGLMYAPSGGIVAAATASLPEQIGGPRNWDYRYCWLRDATFTLEALLDQGYDAAAKRWRDWLLRAVAGDPEDMQIMYGVLGERRLNEYELALDGYENSQPVRVGNAAHLQFQLDVFGELMDSFHSARRAGIDTPSHAWELEKVIVEHVCERWTEPDEGIWEVRSGPEHFVHSKVMAWVALDRGIKAIEQFGEEGPADEWEGVRDEIRSAILDKGVDRELGRFKRSYGSSELDASLLLLPVVGFIEADDPLMVATIDGIEQELVVDGFVHRYRTEAVDDGLPPGEGAFLMCSFWLVDCLVLLGRNDRAEDLFNRLLSTANDLHLLSEQYDAHATRLVGNFPQAFSHVALVTSAAALQSAGRSRSMRRGQS